MQYNKSHDLTEFFETLADAVNVFMHPVQTIPKSNCNGCRVQKGKNKKRGYVKFSFLAKDNSEVVVDINLRDLYADPKTYIDEMLNGINEGLNRMSRESRFILLPGNS